MTSVNSKSEDMRRIAAWTCLSLVVASGIVLRFQILDKYPAPSAADPGHWLTMANILNGIDVTGHGLRYPPLFFVVLNLARMFVDDMTSLKILGSAFSVLGAIPLFALMRRFCSYLPALITTIIFIFPVAFSQVISWGGYPQMMGVTFLIVALLAATRFLENHDLKNGLLLGLAISLVVGAHHFTTAFLTLTLLIVIIVLRTTVHQKLPIRNLVVIFFASFLFSLPYLPAYAALLGARAQVTSVAALPDLIQSFEFWTRQGGGIMLGIALLGGLALAGSGRRLAILSAIIVSSVISSVALSVFSGFTSRGLFFLYIPLSIAFGLFIKVSSEAFDQAFSRRPLTHSLINTLLASTLVVVLLLSTVTSYQVMSESTDYYSYIGNDEKEALEWLRENVPPTAVIATTGSPKTPLGQSYGWWIEGYAVRRAYYTGPLAYFVLKDERDLATRLAGIFSMRDPCAIHVQLAQLGVRYLLVNEGSSLFLLVAGKPDLFVLSYANRSISIFRLSQVYVSSYSD